MSRQSSDGRCHRSRPAEISAWCCTGGLRHRNRDFTGLFRPCVVGNTYDGADNARPITAAWLYRSRADEVVDWSGGRIPPRKGIHPQTQCAADPLGAWHCRMVLIRSITTAQLVPVMALCRFCQCPGPLTAHCHAQRFLPEHPTRLCVAVIGYPCQTRSLDLVG